MSLTKPLNSKVNMKQYSNADLPVNPKQPAIARYAAESTANQTTINLPFQIDTVNAADSFLLMVDGKVLTPGSTNDYQFAGIDSFGFSSTISLNYSLVAGLNIQAIKLGLKKETEFVQDARFTALYEGIDQGLQGFVRTADLMTATTSPGTPAAGQFYSSIINRAAIPDMRLDLKARMGVDRIIIQQMTRIESEIGPNGEYVYGMVNDKIGQVRAVGDFSAANNNSGQYISTGNINFYIEVTFFGTGLSLLTVPVGGLDYRYTVDGGVESSNIAPNYNSLISSRNYSGNAILPIVSGLSLGVHTVRIRPISDSLRVHGFDIINDSSTIIVNPGASYMAGKKATTVSQQNLSYNSVFETGVLGSRGGRVLVYQKADGTVAKSLQPTDASQLNLTSASHANEEVARTYYVREFGSGRADDFSMLSGIPSNRTFTLDDGTTTLAGLNAALSNLGGREGASVSPGTSNYIAFTFVGTGLDIVINANDTTARSLTVSIDGGTSIGTISQIANATTRVVPVVSGLPYGTHTVRFFNGSGAASAVGIIAFSVYQPKRPTLPTGCVEIADYNIMADYNSVAVTGTAIGDHYQIPQGTLFKAVTREFSYVGANWALGSVDPTYASGIVAGPAASTSQPVSYSFFGTGFMLTHLASSGGTYDFSVTIDGALNASGVAKTNASNLGAGSYRSTSTTSGVPCKVEFTGLPLAWHTISIQKTAGAGSWNFSGLNLITPIHFAKSNTTFAQQNTLTVGSQGVADSRHTTIVKDSHLQQKNVSQAYGVTSAPTTTSTSSVPMPEMNVTHTNSSGKIRISYAACMYASSSGIAMDTQVFVDGIAVGQFKRFHSVNNTYVATCLDNFILEVTPGVHNIVLCWSTSSGTLTANVGRTLTVEEI